MTDYEIKKHFSPEFYDYYNSHKGELKPYDNDLTALQVKIFQALKMSNLYSSNNQYSQIQERCILWLKKLMPNSNFTITFKDFQKIFHKQLCNSDIASVDYIQTCEFIINDINGSFSTKAQKALEKKERGERRKLQNLESATNIESNFYHKSTSFLQDSFDNSWSLFYDKSNVEQDILYIKTNNKIIRQMPSNELIQYYCKKWYTKRMNTSKSFEDFITDYTDRVSHYEKNSIMFYAECYNIILHNGEFEETSPTTPFEDTSSDEKRNDKSNFSQKSELDIISTIQNTNHTNSKKIVQAIILPCIVFFVVGFSTLSFLIIRNKNRTEKEAEYRLQQEKEFEYAQKQLETEPSYDSSPSTNTKSTVNTWADIPKILGKNYKVIGIWEGTVPYSPTIIIYKNGNKFYMNTCHLSDPPIDKEFAMRLKNKGKNTFIYNQTGSDMPEMFIINGNQLESYTYNPDFNGGEWVYMGTYNKLY